MEGSTIQNRFEKVQAWHECVRATQIGQRLSCTFDDYFRFHPHKEILCTTEIMWKKIHYIEKLYMIASMGRFHFNWMESLTRWTWVWVNSGSWWWTGRPGVLRFMGLQRVGHDWATDLIYKVKHIFTIILLLLLLSRFSRVRLCVTPETAAHQAPPSLGFSRQEHWSGLPFPSPMHESEKWKWSRSVMSNSSRPMDCSLTGSSIHGIFQARVLELAAIAFSTIILLSNNSK